ncbi:MAG: rod shape-determining protein [Nitrospirae bacterium]|nr:rod shape-determining protein [Nitrospirota bacterium]
MPSVGGRPPRVVSRQVLSEIIEPRAEEIFSLVQRELKKTGYEELVASGAVITGGAALMEGMTEVAERMMDMPVRRGIPSNIGGLVDVVSNPMYSTGVGLILYAVKDHEKKEVKKFADKASFNNVFNKMKGWVKEFF